MTDQEINEAVARNLGWVDSDYPAKGWLKRFYKGPEGEKEYYLDKPEDYCHSIEAAWEVVEHCLKPVGGVAENDFELNHIDEKDGWIASFVDQGELHGTYGYQGRADTPAMAICLAFLKLP